MFCLARNIGQFREQWLVSMEQCWYNDQQGETEEIRRMIRQNVTSYTNVKLNHLVPRGEEPAPNRVNCGTQILNKNVNIIDKSPEPLII